MKIFHFYLFLLFFVISGNLYAEGFYIGGGISSIRLSSEHPSINDQSGTGYQVFAGTKYVNWGIELAATGGLTFNTEPTPGIYYPEDSAEYAVLDLGLKRYFRPQGYAELSPWIGAGLGLHFTDWSTYFYSVSGIGYSLTAGVDLQMDPDWFVRGGMVYHDFKTDDTYGYGPYNDTATQINLAIIYLF